MTDKTIGAIKALLDVSLGAGLLLGGEKKKPAAAKKDPARKVKPRRAGEPAAHKVEVEDIGRGEHLPKDVPVSTEAGFSRDDWAKMRLAKQRKVNNW